MDLGLRNKVIAVTGGASGIGEAITRTCLAEDARVVVLSRVSRGVQEFRAEMESAGLPFEFLEAELGDLAACQSAIAHIESRYGELFALVNNAGGNDSVGLASGTPERFIASLQTNLVGAYALAHHALPMLKRSRGTIVNIASKVAVTGQGNTSGYAAAKGGLLALTREWAAELAADGVRVNCVLPAEVMTPSYQTWLATLPNPDALLRQVETQIPLGRRMTLPDEIASTVAFLLSPTQSAHTTGQLMFVDGGYVHLDRMLTNK